MNLDAHIGSMRLRNPVMTAAGTSGHGDELSAYFDLSSIGAVVVKSLSPQPHNGNPSPRVHELTSGMINAVGLQNGGVEQWVSEELPRLQKSGATIVAAIWGFTVDDYAKAARMLHSVRESIAALEVNISCPNTEASGRMFAQDPVATAEAIAASKEAGLPVWAKLSPNVSDVVPIAAAAIDSGAEALTLTNTLSGMAVDTGTRRAILGNTIGGVSGAALHPVAVRIVHQCRQAFPDVGIVGAGGVATTRDALDFLMAGAGAVQVGTATFADPRACSKIADGISQWCRRHGVSSLQEIVGVAGTGP